MPIELFPDQQEALARVLEVYRICPIGGRALLVAPTAWGKTIFFSALIHALKSDKPVLIIAHRDELLEQAREKIHLIDPTAIVGKVGSGTHEYGAPITVAGIDTISGERHLKNLTRFGYGLVIWDECHHCQAPKYRAVHTVLRESAFHLGVTATPDRLDGKDIEDLFGPPVFQMDILTAIARKRLCNLKKGIAIRTEVNLDSIRTGRTVDGELDYNQNELSRAVDTPERNKRIVEAYQEHTPQKRAVAFCVSVEHATNLADTFNEAGVPAAVMSGATSLPERKQLFSQFRAGTIKVLTNVMVLTEGWDEPLCEVGIMARPTQSRGLYTQQLGRVLRLAPGKAYATILDITDNTLKHRLTRQRLSSVIPLPMRDGETVQEALARAANEEKQAQVRVLPEQRQKDIVIDILGNEELRWVEKAGDMFVLEIGIFKHRIALVPNPNNDGLYSVWARLAPGFEAQKWLDSQPLDWCQQVAEKKARLLLAEPGKIGLVDRTMPWRSKPIEMDSAQVKKARWHKIEVTEGMTKGELSDRIDAYLLKKDQEKAEKEARAAERAAKKAQVSA